MNNNISIRQALLTGWNSFKANWKVWIASGFIVSIPVLPELLYRASLGLYLPENNLPMESRTYLVMAITVLGSVLFAPGLIKLSLQAARGEKLVLSTLFGQWHLCLRMLAFYILYGLAVTVGVVALIIPGIYLAARYSQAPYLLVDQPNQKLFDAMAESSRLTKGKILTLCWAVLMMAVIVFLPLILLSMVVSLLISIGNPSVVFWLTNIAQIVPQTIGSVVIGTALASIYFQLKSSPITAPAEQVAAPAATVE